MFALRWAGQGSRRGTVRKVRPVAPEAYALWHLQVLPQALRNTARLRVIINRYS